MECRFEPLGEEHGPAVMDIFNQAIVSSFSAYPETPIDPSFYGVILSMCRGYPARACLAPDGQVVGFGYVRPYSPFPTFAQTGRLTYFFRPAATRRGLGSRLLALFETRCREMGLVSLVADVSSKNPESLTFHAKRGFVEVGRILRAGRKFDQDFDIVWLQKFL